VVEYEDRLARFGVEYLEAFGGRLVVLNGKEHPEDLQRELAEDLVAIVSSFAARVYGRRVGGKERAEEA